MARNLNIPHKTPNDLLTADEFNTLVVATEESITSKLDLGLENVNNTSDINKPISIATQAALNNKQNNLGFTPENPNNKVVDLITANHTTYPTSLAVSNAIFNSGVVVTDATNTVKGKIALTGDLGGTADVPTVPGLAAKQDILPTGTTTQYLRGDKTLATLSTDVVTEGTTNKYLSSTERNKLNGIAAGATVNDSDVNLKNRLNHTGTQSADTITDGVTNKVYSATDKTKLAGVATGATANSSDAVLLARANHTGTESADNIIDGTTNKAYTATEKTKLSGIATGATANDSDLNLKNRANHTGTQTADTIIDGTTNKVFTAINQTKLNGIATAATANSTDASLRDRSTHTGTQAQSTVVNLVTDLAAKQATLVSGTNIKTVGGTSIVGTGDIAFPVENLTSKFDPNQFDEYDTGTVDGSGNPILNLKIDDKRLRPQSTFLSLANDSGLYTIRGESVIAPFHLCVATTMSTAVNRGTWLSLKKGEVISYISYFQRTVGDYTASGFNGIVLYKYDTVSHLATRVAESANTPDLWKQTVGVHDVPMVTAYTPTEDGLYIALARYESSAQLTGPSIMARVADGTSAVTIGSLKLNFSITGVMPVTTFDVTTGTISTGSYWFGY